MSAFSSFRRVSLVPALALTASCAAEPRAAERDTAARETVPSTPPGSAPTAFGPAASGAITITGATEDGAVVFTRAAGETSLEVLDLETKQTTVLAPRFRPTDRVEVTKSLVAFWTGVEGDVGELAVWTRSSGVWAVDARARTRPMTAREDGSRVAFVRAAAGGGAEIALANADATPKVVQRGVVAGEGACALRLSFAGPHLFTATCADGDAAPTLRRITEGGEVVTVARDAAGGWSTDARGDRVFVVTSTGAGSLHALPDDQSTPLDEGIVWGNVSPDGERVVYRTRDLRLKVAETRAPELGGAVSAEGVREVTALSPSFELALLSREAEDASNEHVVRRDLKLTAVQPYKPFIPTPTKLLVATATGLGIGFTARGEHAVYLSDLPAHGWPVGTLKARGPNARDERVLAQGAFAVTLLPGSSRVVFAHDPRLRGDTLVALDVDVVDAESGDAAATLSRNIDPQFVITGGSLAFTVGHGAIATTPLR